ncbi:Retrovirus-related Pol polyprotein from transposon RE2, partial [Linum grandiflorum]
MSHQISANSPWLTLILATTNSKLVMGHPLLKGDVSNGLYRVPPTLASPTASPHVAYTGVRTSLLGWHQRMAHPYSAILNRMVQLFSLPVSSNKMPDVCEPCQLGKSRRLSLSSPHISSSKPFDLVYSDIWGPAPVLSLNGHRYFFLFIDDCTKFVWIYFLTQKSGVHAYFRRFRTMVNQQF